MDISLGNQKEENVVAGIVVQVDDTHKTAISILNQYVIDSCLSFYGTVVINYEL